MSKKTTKKGGKRHSRPKQGQLPGVEAVSIPEIDDAFDEFMNRKDDAKTAKEKFDAAEKDLRFKVHKHAERVSKLPDGTLVYRRDDQILELLPAKEKLKIRTAPPEEGQAPADTSEGTV